MRVRLLLFWLASAVAPAGAAHAADGRSLGPTRCVSLQGTRVGLAFVKQARMVPAGQVPFEAATPNGRPDLDRTLPEHCLIEAELEPRVGAEGKPYAINVEIRLPSDWNGKLVFQGGGGLNGILNPAVGKAVNQDGDQLPALVRGYAVVSSDSGHTAAPGTMGTDPAFARDQQAKVNYAYAGIGKAAETAQAVITRLAGRAPAKLYFVGCSNGGREGLIAAQRFPLLFDGVIAGNPAFNLSNAVLLAHFSTQKFREGGVTAKDLALVGRAVIAACDGLDGAHDGMIFNHRACRFRARDIVCVAGQSSDCLSLTAADAIDAAFKGPLRQDGSPRYPGWTYDAGVGTPAWLIWQLGAGPEPSAIDGVFPKLVRDTIAQYFSYPQLRDDVGSYPAAVLEHRMAATAAITDATSTDLSTYRQRGGKLLIVTGWSDPIFAPQDLIEWYKEVVTASRESSGVSADSFARLFLVPGMTHCGGGPSPANFDALAALDGWVVKGEAPNALMAQDKGNRSEKRVPICAFPQEARYSRDTASGAEAYKCVPSALD